jgi:hypothetical protein
MFLRPHVLRLLYLAFILSFLLPYTDVRGCVDKKMHSYHGYDLIFKGYGGIIYVLPLCIFALFFILSFRKKKFSTSFRAFGASWKALGAGFSGLVVWFMPRLQFLFDEVFYQPGYALGLICTAGAFVEGVIISIKDFNALRNGRPTVIPDGYSPALMRYHYGISIFSLLLVPAYFFLMHKDVVFAVLIFLFLSLPFVLSQQIVVEGVRRGERWTRRWAIAASVLALAALALTIIGFL